MTDDVAGQTLLEAFNESARLSEQVQPVDAGLVEAGRKLAAQIDSAIASGSEVTKALYLSPHLVNILREMLVTPASRQAAGLVVRESTGGKLAQLRAVASAKPSA